MPVQVLLHTIVTDDAGNVIFESEAPVQYPAQGGTVVADFSPKRVPVRFVPKSNPTDEQIAVMADLLKQPQVATLPPVPAYFTEPEDEDTYTDEEEDIHLFQGSIDLPATLNRSLPILPMVESDPDVRAVFSDVSFDMVTQHQRPVLEGGQVELRQSRGAKRMTKPAEQNGQTAAPTGYIEPTAQRAQALGYRGLNTKNRDIDNLPLASEADGADLNIMA